MSRPSSPIYIPSCSTSPELAYLNVGNTPFPPASPTPFANNVPIPLMNTYMSTPSPTPQFIRDYEDAANNAMVTHMAHMMRMMPEEATAFIAMNQSILKLFLHRVSPPLRPPTPPTPKPLHIPPHYYNLSPKAPDYELLDSEEFLLPPLVPYAASPIKTHVSYLPSLIHNPANDTDKFPDGEWPSNPPSPTSSSSLSDNAPVLQAFIQTTDNPITA